jgi:hypothetical protein
MKYELPKERVFMRASKGGITVENTVITSDGVTYYLNDPYYGEDSWYARTFDPSSGDYDVGEDVKELMENESVTIECEIVDDIPDSEFQLPRGAEIASTGLPAAASEAELMSKWMNDPLEALAKPSL